MVYNGKEGGKQSMDQQKVVQVLKQIFEQRGVEIVGQ